MLGNIHIMLGVRHLLFARLHTTLVAVSITCLLALAFIVYQLSSPQAGTPMSPGSQSCGTWISMPNIPADFDTSAVTLSSVVSDDETGVWVAGWSRSSGSSTVTLASWTGSSLALASEISLPEGDVIINEMKALSSTSIWIVGVILKDRLYYPLVLHWNGRQLAALEFPTSQQNMPSTSKPNALSKPTGISIHSVGIQDADIWAVGSSTANGKTTAEIYRRSKSSWDEVELPNLDDTESSLASVIPLGMNDIWAFGYVRSEASLESPFERPLILHWDGVRWSLSDDNLSQRGSGLITSAIVSGTRNITVIGRNDTGIWMGEKPRGSDTWQLYSGPSIDAYLWTAVQAGSSLWALGEKVRDEAPGAPPSTFASKAYVLRWLHDDWSEVDTHDLAHYRITSAAAFSSQLWAIIQPTGDTDAAHRPIIANYSLCTSGTDEH